MITDLTVYRLDPRWLWMITLWLNPLLVYGGWFTSQAVFSGTSWFVNPKILLALGCLCVLSASILSLGAVMMYVKYRSTVSEARSKVSPTANRQPPTHNLISTSAQKHKKPSFAFTPKSRPPQSLTLNPQTASQVRVDKQNYDSAWMECTETPAAASAWLELEEVSCPRMHCTPNHSTMLGALRVLL